MATSLQWRRRTAKLLERPRSEAYAFQMRPGETLLEMARRHVRDGADHVRQQRELVQHLHATGSPLLDEARLLLTALEASEADHQRHLSEIEEEVRAGRRDRDGNLLPLSRS